MSGAIIMLLANEEGKRLKEYLTTKLGKPEGTGGIQNRHWSFHSRSPEVTEIVLGTCFINLQGNTVNISYNTGTSGDWATAVAYEMCKCVDVHKGGWESTGYASSIEEFKEIKPFDYEVDRKVGFFNRLFKTGEVYRCKKYQEAYLEASSKLFKEM